MNAPQPVICADEAEELARHRAHSLGRAERLVRSIDFQFRTLEQGNDLVTFLSGFFPEPDRVMLGLSELFVNAVEHGNLGIGYAFKTDLNEAGLWEDEIEYRLRLPENRDKFVEARLESSTEFVRVTIRDQGAGFDWYSYLELDPERGMDNHGRGIAIARAMSFDFLEFRGTGNEVCAGITRAGRN